MNKVATEMRDLAEGAKQLMSEGGIPHDAWWPDLLLTGAVEIERLMCCLAVAHGWMLAANAKPEALRAVGYVADETRADNQN